MNPGEQSFLSDGLDVRYQPRRPYRSYGKKSQNHMNTGGDVTCGPLSPSTLSSTFHPSHPQRPRRRCENLGDFSMCSFFQATKD